MSDWDQYEKEAREMLYKFFDGEVAKIDYWMKTKNNNLGGIAPIRLIRLGRGKKLVQIMKEMLEGNIP